MSFDASQEGGFFSGSRRGTGYSAVFQQTYQPHELTTRARITRWARRLTRFRQMDFEVASWQMLYLLINPRKVYRNIYYHRQTKNQWARDDPAFVVLLIPVMAVTAIYYMYVVKGDRYLLFWDTFRILSEPSFGFFFFFFSQFFLLEFVLFGLLISGVAWSAFCFLFGILLVWTQTLIRWLANTYLIAPPRPHMLTEKVEFAYVFDLHCNGFWPYFLIARLLNGLIDPPDMGYNYRPEVHPISKTVSLIGSLYYVYIFWLGLSVLPFLHHTGRFLALAPCLVLIWFISLFF